MSAETAEMIKRLLESDSASSQARLNGLAYELGLVTLQADAATVRMRLKAAAAKVTS